jgi:CCCH-type zinc finger
MIVKLSVPTRLSKEYLLKYLNRDNALQVPDKLKRKHSPHFSNVLCKFYLKNSCSRGQECSFSHDPSQFPCNNQLQNRNCLRQHCQFKHDTSNSDRDVSYHQGSSNSESAEEKKLFVSPFL